MCRASDAVSACGRHIAERRYPYMLDGVIRGRVAPVRPGPLLVLRLLRRERGRNRLGGVTRPPGAAQGKRDDVYPFLKVVWLHRDLAELLGDMVQYAMSAGPGAECVLEKRLLAIKVRHEVVGGVVCGHPQ